MQKVSWQLLLSIPKGMYVDSTVMRVQISRPSILSIFFLFLGFIVRFTFFDLLNQGCAVGSSMWADEGFLRTLVGHCCADLCGKYFRERRENAEEGR